MRILGLEISRSKKSASVNQALVTDVSALRGNGWSRVFESFAGAWQRNVEITAENVLAYSAVFSCVTLIASDIGKLRITLISDDGDGIWSETTNSAYSPVLTKPNRYQTRITFLESWISSKLVHGNTYILKERDNRGVVTALYPLDPTRVKPLVAPDGSVYYDVPADNLAGLPSGIRGIPASEIIHDTMVALYHPLCGVSPITACGLAATQGLQIQRQSTQFFGNGSQPGGLLVVPGVINQEQAAQIQQLWESQYGGDNAGRVAVLGNGLSYQPMSVNAHDAQLIEQLKWSAENVCTAYHVPAYMVGIGTAPSYSNVEALNLQYYGQCLQNPIEKIEVLLDEGLGLSNRLGIELDLTGLLRMDTAAQVKASADSIGGGGMTPNEARRRYFGLGRVGGGDAVYLQQQNYSTAALDRRDSQLDPFAKGAPAVPEPVKVMILDGRKSTEIEATHETPHDAVERFGALLAKELAA